jgi:hypothetical protein
LLRSYHSIILVGAFAACASAFAIGPASTFVKKENFASVQNFRDEKADIDLTTMESDLSYSDLTPENTKALEELVEVKKQYGKVFGFKDWKATSQKLFSDASERSFILQGNYKDAANKTVNFLEVYWANKENKSAQFLITSNSKELKIENYKLYLKP